MAQIEHSSRGWADWTRSYWGFLALGVVASIACSSKSEDPDSSIAADDGSTTGQVGSTTTTADGGSSANGSGSGAETTGDQGTTAGGGGGTVGGISGTFGSIGTTGGGCEVFGICPCEPIPSDVALDEVTPLGFSAEQVLAFAGGLHEAALVYDLNNFSGVELSVPDQATTVTLSIEPTGTASFVTEASIPGRSICANALEIDVEVTLSTADGAFNEHFSDKLLVDDPSRAHLVRAINLESLQGNLSLGLSDGATISESYLNVILGDGFFAGDIAGMISSCEGSSCSAGSVTFALWNDSGCRDRLVPATTTEVITGVLDLVNALSPLTITWGNGEASQLSMNASSLDPLLCHSPELTGGTGGYWLQTELALSSEDGRLDTTLPVEIEGNLTADGTPYVWFLNNYQNLIPVEVTSFEEVYGLSDVAFDSSLDAYLYFFLALDFSAPGSVEGGLDVRDGETVVEPIAISAGE